MNSQLTLPQKISYYRWPMGIVAFFVLLAIGNVFLLQIALREMPDAVEDSPYEKGLHFQQVIDERVRAQQAGLKADVRVGERAERNQRSISVELGVREGHVLDTVQEIRAVFLRPSRAALDTESVLSKSLHNPFVYEGLATLPASGLWQVEILLILPGGRARLEKTLFVS